MAADVKRKEKSAAMHKNRMKAKLLAGKPVFGVTMMFPAPQIVEMLGRLGFDWVLIDCEHGTFSLESVEMMVLAAELSGLTSLARPPVNSPEVILQVMERGVMGVQVPHVSSASEAKQAVEAVKYFPLGQRGLAAGTRPAHYGLHSSMTRYIQEANAETLVCIQLEDRQALENLDELLQVEGVDVFFLGPSDLSQAFGVPGLVDDPLVRDAMTDAFHRIGLAGKISGSAGNAEAIQRYRLQGVQYLYTHLPTLLAGASAAFFARNPREEAEGDEARF